MSGATIHTMRDLLIPNDRDCFLLLNNNNKCCFLYDFDNAEGQGHTVKPSFSPQLYFPERLLPSSGSCLREYSGGRKKRFLGCRFVLFHRVCRENNVSFDCSG